MGRKQDVAKIINNDVNPAANEVYTNVGNMRKMSSECSDRLTKFKEYETTVGEPEFSEKIQELELLKKRMDEYGSYNERTVAKQRKVQELQAQDCTQLQMNDIALEIKRIRDESILKYAELLKNFNELVAVIEKLRTEASSSTSSTIVVTPAVSEEPTSSASKIVDATSTPSSSSTSHITISSSSTVFANQLAAREAEIAILRSQVQQLQVKLEGKNQKEAASLPQPNAAGSGEQPEETGIQGDEAVPILLAGYSGSTSPTKKAPGVELSGVKEENILSSEGDRTEGQPEHQPGAQEGQTEEGQPSLSRAKKA